MAVAIPGSVKCNLIVVLIYISLMISDGKHLFILFPMNFLSFNISSVYSVLVLVAAWAFSSFGE